MSRRRTSRLLILTLAALVVSRAIGGCGKKADQGEPNEPAPASTETPEAPSADESPGADFEGTWVGIEQGRDAGGWTWTFADGQADVVGPGEEAYKGTYTVDATTEPAQVDFTITECAREEYVGLTSLGIYKIEQGKLMLAAAEPGSSERAFAFELGGGGRFWVLEKQ